MTKPKPASRVVRLSLPTNDFDPLQVERLPWQIALSHVEMQRTTQMEQSMSCSCVSKDPALDGNERWYLVHTLPRSELRAQLHLEAQGFKTHLPQISKTVRHSRQLRMVRSPLFARYVFIILDLGRDRWLSVRSTFGVSCLFTCDSRPVPVPAGVVESLMVHDEQANLALCDGLQKGQRVRILSGPFADFVGTLERLDESGRVRVLLQLMGTAVPVATDRSRLLPAA
jgi:transcription elongation factor/antiterminator RfaH